MQRERDKYVSLLIRQYFGMTHYYYSKFEVKKIKQMGEPAEKSAILSTKEYYIIQLRRREVFIYH